MGNNIRRITKQKWYKVKLDNEEEKVELFYEYTESNIKRYYYIVNSGKVFVNNNDLKNQLFNRCFKFGKSKVFNAKENVESKIIIKDKINYLKCNKKRELEYKKNGLSVIKIKDKIYREFYPGEENIIIRSNKFYNDINEFFGYEFKEADTRRYSQSKYPIKMKQEDYNKFMNILKKYKKSDFYIENEKSITIAEKFRRSLRNKFYIELVNLLAKYYTDEKENLSIEEIEKAINHDKEVKSALNITNGTLRNSFDYEITNLKETIENDISNVIKMYAFADLEEVINKKKLNLIVIKEIVNEHFKEKFLNEGYSDESQKWKYDLSNNELIILNMIHNFVKGRYRKIKQIKNDESFNNKAKRLFKQNDLEKKLKERVYSQILTKLKREKRLNWVELENLNDESIYKQAFKAEDVFRSKLLTPLTAVQHLHFTLGTEKEDLIGAGNFPKKKLEKIINNNNISLNELYCVYRLRNHLYHYQHLNENKKTDYTKNYKEEVLSQNAEIRKNIDTMIEENITGNGIQDEKQKEVITTLLKDYRVNLNSTGLPRFSKILSINIEHNKKLKEILGTDEKKDLEYYYQVLYKNKFEQWLEENYVECKVELKKNNYIFKLNKQGYRYETQPRLFKYFDVDNFNINDIRSQITSSSLNDEKLLKSNNNKINIYIAILFNKFINEVDKIDFKSNNQIDNNISEDLKNIISNDYSLYLYAMFDLLKRRNLNQSFQALIKYIQFIESLNSKYNNFDNKWEKLFIGITGEELEYSAYANSMKSLINIMNIKVQYMNAQLLDSLSISSADKKGIKELYTGIGNENQVKYTYYSDNEKVNKDQEVIKIENRETDILNKFILNNEKYGFLTYIKKLHIKQNVDYNELLEIYGIYKSYYNENTEFEKVWKFSCVDEITKNKIEFKGTFIEFIQGKYNELYNKNSEEIQKIKNELKNEKDFKNKLESRLEKYYKGGMYNELKIYKKLINSFNFVHNMISMNILEKVDTIMYEFYSRLSVYFRRIEKDIYGMIENTNKDDGSIFQESNLKLFNLTKKDIENREYITHKNMYQFNDYRKYKENNFTTINEDYKNVKSMLKYSTVDYKAIKDVLTNLLAEYGIKIEMNGMEIVNSEPMNLDKFNQDIPQISKMEVKYLLYYIINI